MNYFDTFTSTNPNCQNMPISNCSEGPLAVSTNSSAQNKCFETLTTQLLHEQWWSNIVHKHSWVENRPTKLIASTRWWRQRLTISSNNNNSKAVIWFSDAEKKENILPKVGNPKLRNWFELPIYLQFCGKQSWTEEQREGEKEPTIGSLLPRKGGGL